MKNEPHVLIQKKKKLEEDLKKLLDKFEEEEGLTVREIRPIRDECSGTAVARITRLDVEILLVG